MKVLLQRVSSGAVSIDNELVGSIGSGLVALIGIARGDSKRDADYLVQKLINLRIFEDAGGKFNLSLKETGGELLLVSQFTLFADTKKGRRPGFTQAAEPAEAEKMFQYFVEIARDTGLKVATGRFQTYMQVTIVNDGPVTIMLDSEEKFDK